VLVLIGWQSPLPLNAQATQQADTGSICVLAFNDANRNKARDPGEGLLADISVDLMVNQNVIIANHITDGTEPFCFKNLPIQQYHVNFSSPTYEASTSNTFALSLSVGEQATREFGAASKATPLDPATNEQRGLSIPLTTPVRLALSIMGAVIAMAFVAAIGMILFALFVRR
jgi:hypothetical protein